MRKLSVLVVLCLVLCASLVYAETTGPADYDYEGSSWWQSKHTHTHGYEQYKDVNDDVNFEGGFHLKAKKYLNEKKTVAISARGEFTAPDFRIFDNDINRTVKATIGPEFVF